MDEWHEKVVRELTAETPAGSVPEPAASLEIAFGEARGAVAYVLELARAHRIAATGNINGDDVWLQLGDGRVRLTLNRREGHVAVNRPDGDEVRVPSAGVPSSQLGTLARRAIDALVARWRAAHRALPADARRSSAPPADFEDEPTKG
jgi:hypothetical protein